jgi:hypothetical protein
MNIPTLGHGAVTIHRANVGRATFYAHHDHYGKLRDILFKPLENVTISEGTIVEVYVPFVR